ncbi:MAG: chorismate mutase [Clostridia bacterium]|nr:chorismate mutase [Clostridia bacterium]
MVRAFRGAITVNNNDAEEILSATAELYDKIVSENELDKEDFVCILFSLTPDLDKVFPARAVREKGVTNVPLMCMAEIPVDGALEKCVRILILSNSDKSNDDIKHIYMRDAVKLRPDLVK